MPRLTTTPSVTTETTVTTVVKLSPKVRTMVKQRCEEYARLAKQTKENKARMKRITGEVDSLFVKEKQGVALVDGCDVDGYRMKLVTGSTKKLDTMALMKAHGLSQDDLNACTDEKPKKSYIKITAPGEKDDEED